MKSLIFLIILIIAGSYITTSCGKGGESLANPIETGQKTSDKKDKGNKGDRDGGKVGDKDGDDGDDSGDGDDDGDDD